MRVLFTGASSFTGYWFVRELAAAGHQVAAAFRGDGNYQGIRAERTRLVRELCETRFGCAFGGDAFLDLARTTSGGFDVLCHHGAEVGDYRSPDFDPYRADPSQPLQIDFFGALGGFCKDRYAIRKNFGKSANNGEMRGLLATGIVVAEFADPQLGDERCVPR